MIDKYALLKQYFGHDGFRPGQEALIDALLSGRDALGVMPTGAGKSICYQLPALAQSGLTLVISPLISLMKDQVTALRESGIPAAFVNSTLTPQEQRDIYDKARAGFYKLIYAAPERLTAGDFLQFSRQVDIALVAVDEAHCVSQWGQDFRPGYLNIAGFIASLNPRPAVAAFTATATAQVKADIERLLELRDPVHVTTGFDRPNLFFEVVRPKYKSSYLLDFVAQRPRQSGVVYCATRKSVEEVCQRLIQKGVSATRYHAGLSDEERQRNQEDFVYDRARVMVATNAFGMGIDKSNVSFVVHYNMPKDIESYYQEAGRAGRDGLPARCCLMFSPGDVQTARFLIENSPDNASLDEATRQSVRLKDLHRLERMTAYCKSTDCLRGRLLRYFGEEAPERCGHCGNCVGAMEERDITIEAQKILSGVARVERKYRSSLGQTVIMAMLRGARNQRVAQLGLDELPTYGALQGLDDATLRQYIDHLIQLDCLRLSDGEYPVLRLGARAGDVLFHGEKVTITLRQESPEASSGRKRRRKGEAAPAVDNSLYESLKALRLILAQREHVPPYMIFSNATLADMAVRHPRTGEDFLQVSGVGQVKAARYASAFLDAIRQWDEENYGQE